MTTLYLVRHAEAEGNLYRRIHGNYNSILTDNGLLQVAAVADRFADIPLDAIYSSDLHRAQETARAIAKTSGLALRTNAGLREINLGQWEDRTWGSVEIEDAARMEQFRMGSPDFSVPDGESFDDLKSRLHRTISDIAAAHEGETVAIVSHGTAIRYALAAFLLLGHHEMDQLGHSDNTAVTCLAVEGDRANLVFADDNSHLSEEISTFARQHWWKEEKGATLDANLYFAPVDFSQILYKGLYLSCRQEGFVELGRDMAIFERQHYLEKAEELLARDSKSLLCTMRRNSIVGMLQLDKERDSAEKAGYISFFYMLPEYREAGLGVQMLGEAVSIYRPLGRAYLRLSCGADNPRALAFYRRHGFAVIAETEEAFGKLYLMQKYIGYGE